MNQKNLIRKVKLLSSIFVKSKKAITARLLESDDYTVLEKERILREIDEELNNLADKSSSWFRNNLKGAYKEGSSDIVGYLKSIGVTQMVYTPYDEQVVQNIIDNATVGMQDAISGLKRSTSSILKKTTQEKLKAIIADGKVSSETLRGIKADLVDYISKRGITLKDGAGRQWTPEAYAEMMARTESMNTYNQGAINQMLYRDLDLAYITSYASCQCDICQQWEGKVVSLTGKTPGFPTLDDAYAEGMFHPNCKHRLRPYKEEVRARAETNTEDMMKEIFETQRKGMQSMGWK